MGHHICRLFCQLMTKGLFHSLWKRVINFDDELRNNSVYYVFVCSPWVICVLMSRCLKINISNNNNIPPDVLCSTTSWSRFSPDKLTLLIHTAITPNLLTQPERRVWTSAVWEPGSFLTKTIEGAEGLDHKSPELFWSVETTKLK